MRKAKLSGEALLQIPIKDLPLRLILMYGDFTGYDDKTASDELGYSRENFRQVVLQLHRRGIEVKGLKHDFRKRP